MDKLIEWVLAQYGIIGILALVVSIVIFKFSTPIIEKLRNVFWKELDYNNKPSKIIKYKMAYWKDFKIQNIQVKDRGRKKILRDLLTIKFEAIDEDLVAPLLAMDANNMEANKISNDILAYMNDVVDKYEAKSRDENIPDAVIMKFSELHSTTLEKFHMNCSMILESNGIYKANSDKLEAIISLLIVLLELTIVDVERTLATLNGSLTGTEYRGVVCG